MAEIKKLVVDVSDYQKSLKYVKTLNLSRADGERIVLSPDGSVRQFEDADSLIYAPDCIGCRLLAWHCVYNETVHDVVVGSMIQAVPKCLSSTKEV